MKHIATYSFSKNGDMETHAKFVCNASFPDMRFVRHTQILQGVRAADAVFLMSHGLKSFALLAACVLLRKPLFCQIHDETPHPGLKFPVIFSLNWLLVRVSRLTIYFSVPERFARFPHRLADLPSVVDPEIVPVKPPEVPDAWAGYLMFGRCESYKYTDDFMQAVKEDLADIVFAGRGWSQVVSPSNLTTVIDRYISNEELAWLIKRAKGTVLPYRSATQSGVAPIISTMGGTAIVKQGMARLTTQLAQYGAYREVTSWRTLMKDGTCILQQKLHAAPNRALSTHYVDQIHSAINSAIPV
jgi:hypothetical protein